MSERLDYAAAVGAVIAAIGTATGALDWTTRPPCPDRYVRLLDIEPVAVVLCGALAVMLGWRLARTLPRTRLPKDVRPATIVVSVLLTVLALLPTLVAFGFLLQHHGQQLDSDCWTF